jgi:hypothetical protein
MALVIIRISEKSMALVKEFGAAHPDEPSPVDAMIAAGYAAKMPKRGRGRPKKDPASK